MLPNIRPEFTWVDKGLLIVPRTGEHGYQREIAEPRRYQGGALMTLRPLGSGAIAESIRRDFCWTLFGALIVVRRQDGNLVALDGGHRLEAIRHLDSVTTVPCLVYRLENVADEATIFRAINRIRTQLSLVDDHRAAIVAKDDLALKIQEIVASGGRYIAKNNRDRDGIFFVKALRRALVANEPATRSSMEIVTRLCEGRRIDEYMFKAFFAAEDRLSAQRQPKSLSREYADSVLATGYDLICREIRRERLNPDKTTKPIDWAKAVVKVVNTFSKSTIRLEQPGRPVKVPQKVRPVEIRSAVGRRRNGGVHAAA